ncbi:MAG: amidophosphoribosyltransferase [Deltaproteobacteria bacterium HGW-Deltaproteobacteria-18]|nr:MAG: amidophosphoribosyltransferase [Deltaproteobacteria bacterium HGW-Deltaproteobacteria-20]PKN41316.1 MAG: amidophosphoribosyltransferase [Deltaproteobacteria bacterium HGW-Deltaproteobacteria-18]
MVGARLARGLAAVLHVAGRRCQFCAAVLEHATDFPLCPDCRELLAPRVGGYCPDCGTCYQDSATPAYSCLSCRLGKPPWSGVAFHGPYSGALRDLIHQHKFNHDHGLGLLLGDLVRQAWGRHCLPCPDCIVPVPMLPARVLDRGFNQSVELARMLGKVIGLAPLLSGLRKTRDTRAQSSLGRAERHRNVAGAFEAATNLSGQHVLLVDDVMTTGATLTACAKACLAAKARRVDIFFLGRAV